MLDEEDTPQLGNMASPLLPLSTALTFRMPMPLPGAVGVPFFEGTNATEFLDRYNNLCKEYLVIDQDKLAKLPRYCLRCSEA
jgi:hypothetical protein